MLIKKSMIYLSLQKKIQMISFRKSALDRAYNRSAVVFDKSFNPGRIFGENVFTGEKMREYLSDEAYARIVNAIDEGVGVDRKVADQVASAMKAWAMGKGATHYTHWFQPLNETTAEKHDAFLMPVETGRAIEKFEGASLVQQEPDASSFPSGGIRNTFEARGYSAWDPSSPAFIMGDTLCIPTIFISYTGEALDYKTPLIKSTLALNKAAVEVAQYFDKNITRVYATLGWEQEYFLVDEALFNARPDLVLTGRTLIGHESAKGQQLEDNYFGVIPQRVLEFMKEFEYEAWRLGIPVKTRHNEVAPNQFELAPVYEEVNIANDHNQLAMVIMDKISRKHGFRVIFHEKPFMGINGSGKHNNWSLATNTGKNLLSPGKTPKTNLMFLTFFINIIKAVSNHADLLRAAIATAGNDYRLGANEAPPAIMSVFIGTQLTHILNELEKKVKKGKMSPDEKTELKVNIGKIPQIILDNTDRNRTSPFAFTGNKFEFRAVGASENCGAAMLALNTMVADSLMAFKKEVDVLIEDGLDKDEAILSMLQKYIVESKPILFEGNGYCDEWISEAAGRGLSNIKNTPDALEAYITKKTIKLLEGHDVLTKKEIIARYHIKLEKYFKKVQIEARILGDLALNHIIPTAVQYQNLLINNVTGMKQILTPKEYKDCASIQLGMIKEISEHIKNIKNKVLLMIDERRKANNTENEVIKARLYCKNVLPFLDDIRQHIDRLEFIIDDEHWPLAKYRELLFTK